MNKVNFFILGIIVGFFITMIVSLILTITVKKPSALDVYRNMTTLEITYKDNIPVDSVVVFK